MLWLALSNAVSISVALQLFKELDKRGLLEEGQHYPLRECHQICPTAQQPMCGCIALSSHIGILKAPLPTLLKFNNKANVK